MIWKYEGKDFAKGNIDRDLAIVLCRENLTSEGKFFDDTLLTFEIETRQEQLQHRSALVEKGTFTKDKKFYFTERAAEKFVMDYASLDEDEKLIWRRADTREIVELTKEEAKPYVQEIKTILRSVYGLVKG